MFLKAYRSCRILSLIARDQLLLGSREHFDGEFLN